ncbi:MAG: hypothetical protein NC039_09270 [Muribaculaceae bacterium]|nr:hypothetical protein [Muribaculaceae bacterium]
MLVERYKLYTGLFFGAMWVLLCYGFVRDEFIPALETVQPFANLLCDIVFLLLGVLTMRSRRDLVMLGSFLLISLVSKYLNHQGMAEWINGFRDYIGLLFTVPFIRYMMSRRDYAGRFTKSMDKQLLIFLWLQVVCLVWQFVKYGANDAGGGSMGYGHSGVVSTLIYVISFYFMTKKWDFDLTYFQNLYANRVYVFLLFPTFLNETKISFIFMLAYFILLMKIDRRFVLRLIIAIPIAIVGFFVLAYAYLMSTNQTADRYVDQDFYIEYLVGHDFDDLVNLAILVEEEEVETDNLWAVDLPRLGRFFVLKDALDHSGGGMAFGAGIGNLKGNNYFSKSAFARKYSWLLKGSVPMSFAWMVQLGWIGLIWLVVNVMTVLFTPNRCALAKNLRLYLLMVFLLMMLYQDQFRLVYYCVIAFYIYMEGLQPQFNNKDLDYETE